MLVNGKEKAEIDVNSRGIAYGDGVFSTIKVEFGKIQLWQLHLARLKKSAKKLYFPEVDWALLSQEIQTFSMQYVAQENSVIKLILIRGSGGRGYSINGCNTIDRIITAHPFPDHYEQWQAKGIALIQCEYQLPINKYLAGLKTLNRLDQVLIKQEIEAKNAIDGIVCDQQGNVIETCSANLFLYKNEQWYTPSLENSGVAGVKRQEILDQAKIKGLNIIKTPLNKLDLLNADALCITNSLMNIVPITQYEKYTYPLKHFAITAQLKTLILKDQLK